MITNLFVAVFMATFYFDRLRSPDAGWGELFVVFVIACNLAGADGALTRLVEKRK